MIKLWGQSNKPEVSVTLVEEPTTASHNTGPPSDTGPSGHVKEDLDEVESDVDGELERTEESPLAEPLEDEETDPEEAEIEDEFVNDGLDLSTEERPRVVVASRSKTKGRTFHYRHFCVDSTPSLRMFCRYLQRLDGGRKNKREAVQCTVDLSKYLYFATKTLNWQHLLDAPQIERYLARLNADGINFPEQLTKLQRIGYGIKFLLLKTDVDDSQINQLTLMQARLKSWETVIRKKSESHRLEREQELAENPADMTGYELLFQESSLEAIESLVSEAAQEGSYLTDSQINLVALWLFAALLYGNSQRPGPVQNLTIEMYRNKKTFVDKGVTYTIIKVR